jgi:hypothetical protein
VWENIVSEYPIFGVLVPKGLPSGVTSLSALETMVLVAVRTTKVDVKRGGGVGGSKETNKAKRSESLKSD